MIHETSLQRPEELDNITAILAALPAGILLFNQAGSIVRDNPAARRMFGRGEIAPGAIRCGDYIGCYNRRTHPNGCGCSARCADCQINNAIMQVLAGGSETIQFQEKEIARDTAEGGNLWIRFNVVPIRSNGERNALLIIEDLTEDKQAEAALVRQHQFQALVADIAADFVAANSANIDEKTNATLRRMGEFFKVDRSDVFLFSPDYSTVANTHEWCGEGIKVVH